MILRQFGSNQTEITFNNGTSIFFSYETPVAGHTLLDGYFKTDTYYSRTTSKHINQYLKHADSYVKTVTLLTFVTQREYNRVMKNNNAQWLRTITMTEPEESVLVEMMQFFNDMGWINDSTQSAYDSLCDKIADPSPFDYEVIEPNGK